MARILTILLLLFCADSFAQASRSGSAFAILPYDHTSPYIFKDCKQADLSASDLRDIEKLLKNSLVKYNAEQEKRFKERVSNQPGYKFDKKNFVIDLKRYKRQYIAVTNGNGEKLVWINCFCDEHPTWRTERVMVFDGGNCFFTLRVNLTTGMFYELMVHGEA